MLRPAKVGITTGQDGGEAPAAKPPEQKDTTMTPWTRRGFIAAGGATLAACTSQPNTVSSGQRIDRAVADALNELYATVPGTQELRAASVGVLVIPDIIRAGFFAGGAYGEGALLIGNATVDYYSVSAVSIGFTFGAQGFNQALFFLTEQALQDFRIADGWVLALGTAVVVDQSGAAAGLDTARFNRPIVEVVFGQRGLLADASLAGAKYSRIIR